VAIRRLIPTILLCTVLVLGGTFLLGTTTAPTAQGAVRHTCSAPDRQFLQTVSMNMTELGFWSDQLASGETPAAEVVRQAFAEAAQVTATRPVDPTLARAQGMLRVMFQEYGRAIRAKMHGRPGGTHMGLSWRLAYDVHDVLADARPALAKLGCDPAPLIGTT
jgi:hypothetical protein